LARHRTVLDELSPRAPEERELLAMTCSWSSSFKPVPQKKGISGLPKHSTYWRSVLRERDEDEEYWTHVYVCRIGLHSKEIDLLLRLVAVDKTRDVILSDPTLEWLYHPYDGGADVIARSSEERDVLKARHSSWLPALGDL
jgi:hypothetical protein